MKKCFKCLCEKPLDAFYKHVGMADGHLNKCKECTKQEVRRNRAERVDQYREYDRARAGLDKRIKARSAYAASDKGRQAARRSSRAYRGAHPHRVVANNAVNNAIRDGRLAPQPCHCCGSQTAEAHHPDYSRPLDVVWLCKQHHDELHREHREYQRNQSSGTAAESSTNDQH